MKILKSWRLAADKGGLFVSEYHNGARRGCLRVPAGVKSGGLALLEARFREFFLGFHLSRLGKEVVAVGGGFEKSTSYQRSQVWKN